VALTRRTWLGLTAGAAFGNQPARWRPVLAIDDPGYNIRLTGACAPGARHLLAAGDLTRLLDRSRQHLLFYSEDHGANWVRRKAPDRPLAVCALGSSHVWLLGERRLSFSSDEGREWRSLNRPRHAEGLHFVSSHRGYCFAGDRVFRTEDGGANWKTIPESVFEPKPQSLIWLLARFVDERRGWIAGASELPAPEDARGPEGEELTRQQRRRLRQPALALLETNDGGASWQASLAPAPGILADLLPDGDTLTAAFAGEEYSRFPGVIAARNAGDPVWRVLLREEGLHVHSLWRTAQGLLAAGGAGQRIRVQLKPDQEPWRPVPVHYSAQSPVARFFAGPDGEPWLWLASGMILAPVS